jgi:hypothetical protein
LETVLRAEAPVLELQALVDVGLAEAAGGEPQLRAAYRSLSEAAQEAAPGSGTVAAGRYSAPIPAAGEPSGLGALMTMPGSVTVVSAPGVVSLGNDMEPGSAPASLPNDSRFGSSVVTASHGSGALEASINVTGTGAGYTGKATMKTQPCPTPEGQITTSGQLDSRLSIGTDATGLNLTIDYEIIAHVDDDARITNTDLQLRVQGASFQDRKGSYVDQTITLSKAGAAVTPGSATVTRQGGRVTQAQADGWARLALSQVLVLELTLVPELQKALESGRCVQVTADPASKEGLAPSTPVSVTVTARSRVDGAQAGGTISARLEGGTSVEPAGQKVPADATFAYTAPAEVDRTARVLFEARSKRGVGKGTAFFSTNVNEVFTLTGTAPSQPNGLAFKGVACPISVPFKVKVSKDLQGTLTFTPTNDTDGRWKFRGKVSNAPFKVTGSGKYTLNIAQDRTSGTLDFNFVTTIEIPVVGNQTNGARVSLTLAPGGC